MQLHVELYFIFFDTLCFSNVLFVHSADGLASLPCFFKTFSHQEIILNLFGTLRKWNWTCRCVGGMWKKKPCYDGWGLGLVWWQTCQLLEQGASSVSEQRRRDEWFAPGETGLRLIAGSMRSRWAVALSGRGTLCALSTEHLGVNLSFPHLPVSVLMFFTRSRGTR